MGDPYYQEPDVDMEAELSTALLEQQHHDIFDSPDTDSSGCDLTTLLTDDQINALPLSHQELAIYDREQTLGRLGVDSICEYLEQQESPEYQG